MPDDNLFVHNIAAVTAKTIGIGTAFLASGGIASLSLFNVPMLQSQPAERSLPQTRWLFSRGSHIFPQAANLSALSFTYLAYAALPPAKKAWTQILKVFYFNNGRIVNGYVLAALLCLGIGPYTSFRMLETNFQIIQMNESAGGARSKKSAELNDLKASQARTARESVAGEGQAEEFEDVSGPQEVTLQSTTPEEDEKVRKLLGDFGRKNLVRAGLMALGGIVGTITAVM